VVVMVVVASTLPPWDGRREWDCVVVVGVATAPSSGRRRLNGPARFCEYAARNCDLRTPRTQQRQHGANRGEKRNRVAHGGMRARTRPPHELTTAARGNTQRGCTVHVDTGSGAPRTV
jgi:hypothetical protein